MGKRPRLLVLLIFLLGCARASQTYWPVLKSPATEKPKEEKICIQMEGKEATTYKLKVSLYPSKGRFTCMTPNIPYHIKRYLRSELADFKEVTFLGPGDKPPAGCHLLVLSWENKYEGYVKGGIGILGKTYMIGTKIHCQLKGEKGTYNCSVLGWDPIPESRFMGPEVYLCKNTPVEVFFSKIAAKVAYKMALVVRRAVLIELGYPVPPELEMAVKKMEMEFQG